MKASLVFTSALRESRGARGRLVFFTACLALGVMAVVGVGALAASIDEAIRAQSRELLGADFVVRAMRPLPPDLDAQLDLVEGEERVAVRQLATMARGAQSGRSRLVELKAVGARFPFYGAVVTDPPLASLADLGAQRVAVGPELLTALDVAVGGEISLGEAQFTIAAVVVDEPGRLNASFTSGARVFATIEGFERTRLQQVGSRISHEALVRWPDAGAQDLEGFVTTLRVALKDAEYLRIESAKDAQPAVRRSIQRVERYLALVALLSLVLGGVGVAQIVRAWVASRTQSVAVLRVLGFTPREVLAMYAGHVVLLALLGSVLGALAGSLLPFSFPLLFPEVLPKSFEFHWQPMPVLRGIAMGTIVALVFSLPALTAVWRVPPARVLRHEAEPLPQNRIASASAALVLAAGVFASGWAQSGRAVWAASFTGGALVLLGLLWLGARALSGLSARIPRERLPAVLVHGVAALARPGAGVLGAVVALGLGSLVVVAMSLVEARLSSRLANALPSNAPSAFFIDVQPDQWPQIDARLGALGASSIRGVPVATARLSSIDGIAVKRASDRTSEESEGRERWALTREQRITWSQTLAEDNEIVAGTLWNDPSRLEMSLEESFAEDIGAKLGSELVFDVQGAPVSVVVTSLRRVEWESFGINFFLVAEPGAFDAAPHSYLAAARFPSDAEQRAQDEIASAFPNVTMIRVLGILEKVAGILGRFALGVQVLGGFTVLVGLAILFGVASTSALGRAREVALLKTLGVTRAGIAKLFATEFALLGLVAGAIGALGATGLAWAFLGYVAEIGSDTPWWTVPAGAGATALLAAVCGLLASARALNARPIDSLRG